MSGFDPAELAAQARRTLATPAQATLLVSGLGNPATTGPGVVLHDRDGEPTFLCEPGSAVVAAAREEREALLTLRCPPADAPAVSVVFVGRLVVLGSEQVEGVAFGVIALPPTRVYVEHDDPERPSVAQLAVPLAQYRRADDGLLTRQFRRVAAHTNHAHQTELRQFAARRSGVPIEQIAGASLARLDECGAQVHWVDATGAHTATLEFPTRVSCARTLAATLRGQLTEL